MFLLNENYSKLHTGFPTLHMRPPSLCMQALSLGYSSAWTNRAGANLQTRSDTFVSVFRVRRLPNERLTLIRLPSKIRSFLIIQGCVIRTMVRTAHPTAAQVIQPSFQTPLCRLNNNIFKSLILQVHAIPSLGSFRGRGHLCRHTR